MLNCQLLIGWSPLFSDRADGAAGGANWQAPQVAPPQWGSPMVNVMCHRAGAWCWLDEHGMEPITRLPFAWLLWAAPVMSFERGWERRDFFLYFPFNLYCRCKEKQMLQVWKCSTDLKLDAIHTVTEPSYFNMTYTLIKSHVIHMLNIFINVLSSCLPILIIMQYIRKFFHSFSRKYT